MKEGNLERQAEILSICMDCRAIMINEEWKLPQDALYQEFIDLYEGRLSHTWCPECYKKIKVK